VFLRELSQGDELLAGQTVLRRARDFRHDPEVNVFMSALEGADNRRQPVIARAAVCAKTNGFRVVGSAAQAFLCVVNHLKGPARGFQ
jgi:hypothetical protein